MANDINLPQPNINPGYIPAGPPAPSPFELLLRGFEAGRQIQEQRNRDRQWADEMALRRSIASSSQSQEAARIALDATRLSVVTTQNAAELDRNRQAGAALLNWLNNGANPATAPTYKLDGSVIAGPISQPSAGAFATPQDGGSPLAMPVQRPAQTPMQPPSPRSGQGRGIVATPPPTTAGGSIALPENPLSSFAASLNGINPGAVIEAVQRGTPLLQMQAEHQAKLESLQRINAAVANIKDKGQRDATVAMIGMAEAGVHPTEAQISKMLPALAVVDPSTMNSAFDAWRSTGQAWGNVRSAFHLPPSAIPDGIVYTGPITSKKGELTPDEAKAAQLGENMIAQDALIRQMTASGTRIDFRGSWLAGIEKPGAWAQYVSSQQNPDVRQLLNSSLEWAQSVTFLESGAQTNPKEAFVKQQALLPNRGDDDATIRAKESLRQVMNMSMLDRAGGKITATQMVDRALSVPSLTPNIRKALMDQRREAVAYDASRASGRAPIQADNTPTDSTNFSAQMQTANDIIQRTLGTKKKTPPSKQPRSTGAGGSTF